MLQIRLFVLCFVVSMRFVSSYGDQIPFHLRFIGRNSQGFEITYPRYNITYGTAVNLCHKLCTEQWWCTALRKCADRPRLFQCDVVCQFNSLQLARYTKGKERCVLVQANQIGPNVAAKKTVRVVSDTIYYYFYPEYAADTVTICPENALFLHTIFTKDPWIKIVIGQFVDISMVVIYNRQITKGDRFQNALVEVGEDNVWRPCGFYKGPGVNYQIIFVICNEAVQGDTLMISVKTAPGVVTALQLCEVEVFERT